jgi:hypothetical protein
LSPSWISALHGKERFRPSARLSRKAQAGSVGFLAQRSRVLPMQRSRRCARSSVSPCMPTRLQPALSESVVGAAGRLAGSGKEVFWRSARIVG